MARYVKQLPMAYHPQDLANWTHQYLLNSGFQYKEKNGEKIYQKGMGLLTAPQFIKVSFYDNMAQVEAWIKFALLPGVYVGEMGLEGVFGGIPKVSLKKTVNYIESAILGQLSVQ